ncbi:MAG: hypothetical protein ACK521_08650 [bacterium]
MRSSSNSTASLKELLIGTTGHFSIKQVGFFTQPGNMGRLSQTKTNQDSFCIHKVGTQITSTNMNMHPVKEENSKQKNEWLIVVADGHGALGHNVSQMIVETIPKTFEENKKKMQKQLDQ